MFIVLEGIDSSGKKTQINLLYKKLKKEGFSPELLEFPTYEKSPYGELVGKYLRGELGKKNEIAPEIPSLLYAIDRYQFKDELFDKLIKGKILIADRYLQSNIGFQAAKFEGQARFTFIDWLEEVESRMPQADIVIFLDIPPEVSKQLMKGEKKDIYEKDLGYQKKVRETYLQTAKREGWVVVNCCNKDAKRLKTPEEIHEEIWNGIKGNLPKH